MLRLYAWKSRRDFCTISLPPSLTSWARRHREASPRSPALPCWYPGKKNQQSSTIICQHTVQTTNKHVSTVCAECGIKAAFNISWCSLLVRRKKTTDCTAEKVTRKKNKGYNQKKKINCIMCQRNTTPFLSLSLTQEPQLLPKTHKISFYEYCFAEGKFQQRNKRGGGRKTSKKRNQVKRIIVSP